MISDGKIPDKRALKKFRNRLDEEDVDARLAAGLIGRSTSYVGLRFNGHEAWTIDEAVELCLAANIPLAELLRYCYRFYDQLPDEVLK